MLHVNISVFTELIEQEDCGTTLFVLLLKQMVDRHTEDDLRAVLHLLMRMIKICLGVSNRFHANGIVASLHQFYFVTTPREMLPFVSLLVFTILYFANIEALTEEDLWLGIAHQVNLVIYFSTIQQPFLTYPVPINTSICNSFNTHYINI